MVEFPTNIVWDSLPYKARPIDWCSRFNIRIPRLRLLSKHPCYGQVVAHIMWRKYAIPDTGSGAQPERALCSHYDHLNQLNSARRHNNVADEP